MRLSFAALLALFIPVSMMRGQDPFPNTSPVEFAFTETYDDVIVADPDFPSESISVGRNVISISGSAPLALTKDQLEDIDEFTDFEIDVGDFNYSGSLGDDENFDSFAGNRSVNIPVEGFDFDGNDIRIGTISLRWSATRVVFTATIRNAPDDYWIAAIDYYPDVVEPEIDREDLLAAFVFGDFAFDTRTVYMRGSASTRVQTQGGFDFTLSTVRLEASIDSIAPVIVFTEPAPSKTKVTTNDVVNETYTISGTVSDTRKVGATTFAGVVTKVEVQFGPEAVPGAFVEANFDVNTGVWTLPNAPIEAGRNSLVVRATDEHGNVGFTTKRILTYTSKGDLTVTGVAADFAPEDTGKVAGVVSGEELVGKANRFDVVVGAAPVINKRGGIESGQLFRVVATPQPGVAFDGWTGTINGQVRFTSVSRVLDFETKPNLIVSARFVPNPFGPLAGTYHGYVHGDDAAERGTMLVKVKKTGAFTGKVSVGGFSLPIKGIVLGGGRWEGVVTKKGRQFLVTFDLNVSDTGDRLLTGTVTSDDINSTLSADLQDWRKPSRSNPGKTADQYAGVYTFVMTADGDNDNPNFPLGIGFGRVKIAKLGKVVIVGKLGDGSKFALTAVLVRRASGAVFFNVFVPLDKKLGNFGGTVTLDETQAQTDLRGTLDWAEPRTTGVEPDPFDGRVDFFGARYVKPATGIRVMLEAAGGNGRLRLFAPAYSKPVTATAFALFIEANPANLNTVNRIGPVASEAVKIEFSAPTGFFRGTYKDPDLRSLVSVAGAVVQKMNGGAGYAGGVIVRGNRAGYVEFTPVAP